MFSFAETPYGEMTGSNVYYSLKQGQRLERPIHCPITIYQLMLKCWDWDEKKRPQFSQLFQWLQIDPQTNSETRSCDLDSETIVQF